MCPSPMNPTFMRHLFLHAGEIPSERDDEIIHRCESSAEILLEERAEEFEQPWRSRLLGARLRECRGHGPGEVREHRRLERAKRLRQEQQVAQGADRLRRVRRTDGHLDEGVARAEGPAEEASPAKVTLAI